MRLYSLRLRQGLCAIPRFCSWKFPVKIFACGGSPSGPYWVSITLTTHSVTLSERWSTEEDWSICRSTSDSYRYSVSSFSYSIFQRFFLQSQQYFCSLRSISKRCWCCCSSRIASWCLSLGQLHSVCLILSNNFSKKKLFTTLTGKTGWYQLCLLELDLADLDWCFDYSDSFNKGFGRASFSM